MVNNLSELRKCENVIVRKVEEKYYILGHGKCLELNETGILVVKYIGTDMLMDEFCTRLGKKYGAENMLDQVKSDVDFFIVFLCENGMIECV